MAVTSSQGLALGTSAPDFSLPAANPDVSGETVSLDAFSDAKALLVVFTCNHCPYAIAVEDRLIALARRHADAGLATVAVSSNDAEAYPADSFENMAARATEKAYPFPYLYDESQATARAYDAACTPDFYLFDGDRRLAYAGRMDDGRPTRPGRPGTDPTTSELTDAIGQVLAGEPVTVEPVPSLGCSIKWK
jgi:peroxiredoxin